MEEKCRWIFVTTPSIDPHQRSELWLLLCCCCMMGGIGYSSAVVVVVAK